MRVVIEIFSDVEPDPSTRTVEKGYKKMAAFEPDTIIALGVDHQWMRLRRCGCFMRIQIHHSLVLNKSS